MKSQDKNSPRPVHGEGNYEASERYRKGAEKHAQTADVDKQGQAAKKSLEGAEKRELEEAEKEGKSKAKSDPSDDRTFGPA